MADFLTSHDWPFHSTVPTRATVLRQVADGHFDGPSAQTFWLSGGELRVGFVRLFDLDDGAPLFDLRVAPAHRGRGVGRAAVGWLTRHLFSTWPGIDRIEATTRADHRAMRALLRGHGFVKEAHYRESWPGHDGTRHDGVGYALLRRDWRSGRTTPVRFADEPENTRD